MDHSRAPVLEALGAYHEEGRLAFTPPGHKQGRGADPRVRAALGDALFRADVLATAGLDDRRSTGEVLLQAEELMADAVHADLAYFSTCGSSLSVKAAMLAVAGPGERLLIGRDVHKSVAAGLILSGVHPVWVDPEWDRSLHFAHPPSARAYAKAFAEHPEAAGALVTSPTPYGGCADLAGAVQACHERGRPLIVDEAWGAHLPFHPRLPAWAMDAGADLCVTSVHKTGAGLEQGSVYHVQGDLVDPVKLRARADLVGTTSPSVLVYAALDGWRRQMVEHGRELFDHALRLAATTRQRIGLIPGLRLYGRSEYCALHRAADFDPLQLVVDLAGLRTDGYQAADWLRAHHRMDLHLADHRRISAQLSLADDRHTVSALVDALRDLVDHVGELRPAAEIDVPDPADLRLEQALTPREAFFGAAEAIPVTRAAGRIAAEVLTPYPPGVPAALPGERLSREVVEYLRTGVAAGMVVPDAADGTLDTLRVVV
ncbi:aminotransferase class I/II-fold pyridoxal phosphate-dependent enzyme [Kitasatospora sp. A2-31]|uniref:aminotransferase class I/II-fold pyridoxal phosphate-dependent enzyme n=1 Tax=Kitasatospora sp. A2-31 TaxID=2916414 RepID=UPI001EEAF3C6|nr:ornithine decarboxylase [Kitasatospora sp. A2-31]MCG6494253.1 ornithine decarboxylase [Kitasatospora sp. A2-31]